MLANSHLTAIARRGASAPCRFLERTGRIKGRTLDWGCGRGADARHLNCRGYDPYHHPLKPHTSEQYDTILCTYVLNTIPEYHDRCAIVAEALGYLEVGGTLYIAIRADKSNLKGWTSKGTWQGYVGEQLEVGGFDLICSNSDYQIWAWTKLPEV